MADLLESARDFVRRATGLELDLSVESLAYVDHYLKQAGEVSDHILGLIAPALGAYFGEVILGRLGGTWHMHGQPQNWTISLAAAPIKLSPAALVAESLRHASVDDYDGSIHVPADLENDVALALEAVSPVEEDYYYSLTGRLESLEHIVDLVVELRRRQIAAKP